MRRRKVKKAFVFTMGFFLFLFAFFSFNKSNFFLRAADLLQWEQEIKQVEIDIKEVLELKMGYEARAVHHENKAQRLQFMQGQLQVAKRHWNLALKNREIVDKLEEELKILEGKKQSIFDANQ